MSVIKKITISESETGIIADQSFENPSAFNVAIYELDDVIGDRYYKSKVTIEMVTATGKAVNYSLRYDIGCDQVDILNRAIEGAKESISLLPLVKSMGDHEKALAVANAKLALALFEVAKLEEEAAFLALIS